MAAQFESEYEKLHGSSLPNQERMRAFLLLFEQFKHYNILKENFVYMNLFDILIGNQDRHGHNWQLLYRQDKVFSSPLYDNGASLGWQLPDERLKIILTSPEVMHRLYKNTLLKIGLDNNQSPKIKVTSILDYLFTQYPQYSNRFLDKLEAFDIDYFEEYCSNLPLISETRKKFLVQYISYRQQQIIKKLKGGSAK
ncbi:hypothetical protein P6709_11960 [Jeotgalibacillus sp. ET6]|uniref:hypothetical protein n=1 Tax=Jeotgalibacillus sp. ET6 TaxID=3037260 RepID=UPI0024184285|nr:hypothetical protein [Jeotgalibacillus sp. ET6]MDG5472460.1 hypothetical protein [Jeotgalibacillus sp. ET6]